MLCFVYFIVCKQSKSLLKITLKDSHVRKIKTSEAHFSDDIVPPGVNKA